MLQSEFFERTKVNLDPNQYAKVEAVYNEVQMDKDEFCAEWKKLRNNRLMGEVETAMHTLARENEAKDRRIVILEAQLQEKDRFHLEQMEVQSKRYGEQSIALAKKIVASLSDEKRLYDVLEENFGIGFIIRTKHEAGIPLSEEEINYMVGKL